MSTLKEKREAAGLSQADLSRASGVAQPNIAAYESGRRSLSPSMEKRLVESIKARPSIVLSRHRKAILDLARKYHASNVRVFGSVARGEDRVDSDIDLLVRFDDKASLYDQSNLILDLRDLVGIKVDVVSDGGLTPRHTRILAEARPL